MAPSLRPPAALLFAGSGLLLAGALAFQYLGGLAPCELCLWQRIPHAAVLMLAAAAAALARRTPLLAVFATALAGATLVAGSAIAGFHVGVEQHLWEGTAQCGGNAADTDSATALVDSLLAQDVARCDEVAWSLFGVSMAGYNMVISAGMAAFAFFSAWKAVQTGGPE